MAGESESRTLSGPVISWASVMVVFLLVAAASYGALIQAPEEATMGLVQRIFYFHVASAWTGFVAFIMVFIGSVAYLRTRALKWDWLSVASAEVGVAFFTIVLVTGPSGPSLCGESGGRGRPPDFLVPAVGPVRELPHLANARRRAGAPRDGVGGIRNFRDTGYSAGCISRSGGSGRSTRNL